MKTNDFNFTLPEHLIAQHPLSSRSASRLLVYHRQTQQINHRQFNNIGDYLKPGDLLVMNNSRVMKARLYGHKASGGRIELLIERIINPYECWCHIRASHAPKAGTQLMIDNNINWEVVTKQDHLYRCRSSHDLFEVMNQSGHLPLPPYIQRAPDQEDGERYQTVYAEPIGSVAAPTAGLHFDAPLLEHLRQQGIEFAQVTLHVGAGTFQPVRTESIHDHQMHAEYFEISESVCEMVNQAKHEGRRVIAVGSTATRALESAAQGRSLLPYQGETSIFITPGYTFKIIDGIITNFHLPESTLLMMVAAWVGFDAMHRIYQEAVHQEYRFFSYGDASLLL